MRQCYRCSVASMLHGWYVIFCKPLHMCGAADSRRFSSCKGESQDCLLPSVKHRAMQL